MIQSAQSNQNSQPLSHEETDRFLDTVTEQITLETFDSTDQNTLRQLVECLGDTRGMTRLRAAEALGDIGESATPLLIDALANHPNVVVRRAAGKTLTLIADPIAVPHLIHALLTDEDTVVKGSSVGALARIGEAAVPPLLEILAAPDSPESTKGHAAWALAFMGSEAKEYLSPAMASDSPAVRGAIVGAIAKVIQEDPKPELFEMLVSTLTDTDQDVRCEAAAALGNLVYAPALPNLVALLQHDDWITRKAAVLAIMKIGDLQVIPVLQSALAQESETSLHPIFNLAISQIQRKAAEEGSF
jgi:bilin biosynthesis protein